MFRLTITYMQDKYCSDCHECTVQKYETRERNHYYKTQIFQAARPQQYSPRRPESLYNHLSNAKSFPKKHDCIDLQETSDAEHRKFLPNKVVAHNCNHNSYSDAEHRRTLPKKYDAHNCNHNLYIPARFRTWFIFAACSSQACVLTLSATMDSLPLLRSHAFPQKGSCADCDCSCAQNASSEGICGVLRRCTDCDCSRAHQASSEGICGVLRRWFLASQCNHASLEGILRCSNDYSATHASWEGIVAALRIGRSEFCNSDCVRAFHIFAQCICCVSHHVTFAGRLKYVVQGALLRPCCSRLIFSVSSKCIVLLMWLGETKSVSRLFRCPVSKGFLCLDCWSRRVNFECIFSAFVCRMILWCANQILYAMGLRSVFGYWELFENYAGIFSVASFGRCGALGDWGRNKCLQKSVIACFGKRRGRRLANVLRFLCCNDELSGYGGSVMQAWNFFCVEQVLLNENVCVWVYEFESAVGCIEKRCRGCYYLGNQCGVQIGSLIWLSSEQHVEVWQLDEATRKSYMAGAKVPGLVRWREGLVGAPKQSRRGEHLRKGARNVVGPKGEVASHVAGDGVSAEVASPARDGVDAALAPAAVAHSSARQEKANTTMDENLHMQPFCVRRCDGLDDSSSEEELRGKRASVAGGKQPAQIGGLDDSNFETRNNVCSSQTKKTFGPGHNRKAAANPLAKVAGLDDSSGEECGDNGRSSRKQSFRKVAGLDESSGEEQCQVRRSARIPSRFRGLGHMENDEDVLRGACLSKRVRVLDEERIADEDEAQPYRPDVVDASRCQALMCNKGLGRLQCQHPPQHGEILCFMHARDLKGKRSKDYGLVRGPMPVRALNKLRNIALRSVKKEKSCYYSRHLMWNFALKQVSALNDLNEVDEEGLYLLNDAAYEACLKAVHVHIAKHRMQQTHDSNAGPRNFEDRTGGGKYGSARECYNGTGGGRVFKWYTRAVFNNYLKRMGVSEGSCSEKQCMLALAATSDELRKYPMLLERLKAFHGPQCFAHLDSTHVDYRINANQYANEDASHPDVAGGSKKVGADVLDARCWLQCRRCQRWRFVDAASALVLRGDEFSKVRETDLDWQKWLEGAAHRYEYAHANHVNLNEYKNPDFSEQNSVEYQGGQREGANVLGRRLRRKTSEAERPGQKIPTGEDMQSSVGEPAEITRRLRRKTSGAELPVSEALGVEKVCAMDAAGNAGGSHAGSSSDDGKGGSEGEEISIALAANAAPATMPLPLGFASQNSMRKNQAAFAVPLLKVRKSLELIEKVKAFLSGLVGKDLKQFRISGREADDLWKTWQGVDNDEVPFGEALQKIRFRISKRRKQSSVAEVDNVAEKRVLALQFQDYFRADILHFECNMLQKEIENEYGKVSWVDVSCGDEDDFQFLWAMRWPLSDFVRGDDVLVLPSCRPDEWAGPLQMIAVGISAANHILLRGVLLRLAEKVIYDAAPMDCGANDIMGRRSLYEDRMKNNCSKVVGDAQEICNKRGRPSKVSTSRCKVNQHDDLERIALRFPPVGFAEKLSRGQREMHLARHDQNSCWSPQAYAISTHSGKHLNNDQIFEGAAVLRGMQILPAKKMPVRVAKYEVDLREASLRSVQAMHTILSRMVLFTCYECQERFPTFHPAFEPPHCIAKDMELLKRGRQGLACCSIEVYSWEEFPLLDVADGAAGQYFGCCMRCHKDLVEQTRSLPEDDLQSKAVSLRSEENHMDPCFRFPRDELGDLFNQATTVEAMLVALEHMQVNFVTVSRSLLRKFRRNTISFPQDIVGFAKKLGFMRNYRPGDRVNSLRGFDIDSENPDRAVRRVTEASDLERENYVVDSDGCLVFPATVKERRADGMLIVEFDSGGQAMERSENVTPRLAMPWSPCDVPLHLMLRRNLGRGKGALEGLQVRWFYVANLLQALTALAPQGHLWRLGGNSDEPMHKYYDRKQFHIGNRDMRARELRVHYAPKERSGVVLTTQEVENMSQREREAAAVDVTTPEHFIAAGFDVHFVGEVDALEVAQIRRSEEQALAEGADANGEITKDSEDDHAGNAMEESDVFSEPMYVDEETFRVWLDTREFVISYSVQKWWADLDLCEEGGIVGLKAADDETAIDLFRRVRAQLKESHDESNGLDSCGAAVLRDNAILLRSLFFWLREAGALPKNMVDVPDDVVMDDLLHEFYIASRFRADDHTDRGCVEMPIEAAEEEAEAQQAAERLVYGWPSKNADPVPVYAMGRFVKSFPLDFPMGIADLNEERLRKVSPEVWVQHLLRYNTGHFVGGVRGQRVLWALVNMLLLSEARSRGFGIYRNVVRRVGLGLQGGGVLTKGALRDMVKMEGSMRVLVGQLSTVGRDVRSTTMHWAYEGKKLDCSVKHLSWVPPWVNSIVAGDVSVGRRFLSDDQVVEDDVGLGRHPCLWWTMNCHYNAAFDVQRLNRASAKDVFALDDQHEGDRAARCAFTRDCADLVATQLTCRTELQMRIVMPSVVRHSEEFPYLAMARMEVGAGGNPHFHGFSVGLPPPVMKRVLADVEGDDDLPPDTGNEDFAKVLSWLRSDAGLREWPEGEAFKYVQVGNLLRLAVADKDADVAREGAEEDDVRNDDAGFRDELDEVFWNERIQLLLDLLVAEGEVEQFKLAEDPAVDQASEDLYRRVNKVSAFVATPRKRGSACDIVKQEQADVAFKHASSTGVIDVESLECASPLRDFGVLHARQAERQSQRSLEKQFAAFFQEMVSEWNPCYTEDGRWRYKWDEEVGAYDVEVEAGLLAGPGLLTSEEKALRDVTPQAPDRINLRALLDNVFEEKMEGGTDIQRVRRLVAALVQRVARHTKHGVDPPKVGVHACARGNDKHTYCRYGCPWDRVPRDNARPMKMEKGLREGQWHAHFPRNDRLCCSYEVHVLLGNLGNIDWRPVLNLWAIVQYVTKYATKAPKGSRKLRDVLDDAIEEVCTYVPEGEGSDLLRRSIQKFFARTLGERDYHVYEAVQIGLNLPEVIPLMPVISLNTAGARPLRCYQELKNADDDAPVHYDSRVDKFNKRLELLRKQRADGDLSISERDVQDLSLYEFWWKFFVYKGRVKRSTHSVCLMLTPAYSADCANVEHASHESYARAAVIGYWRHMPTAERHRQIDQCPHVLSVDRVCYGATKFETPFSVAGAAGLDRCLGVQDLYQKFEQGTDDCWGLALLEMLVDPMLSQWVPAWLVEQFDRANPYFREVLMVLVVKARERDIVRNKTLLKRTKKEMVKRYRRRQQVDNSKREGVDGESTDVDVGGDACVEGESDGGDKLSGAEDPLAQLLPMAEAEHPHDEPVEMLRELLPHPGGVGDVDQGDPAWVHRTTEERLSAAGPAPCAKDVRVGVDLKHGDLGTLFNPPSSVFDWVRDSSNVADSEYPRIEALTKDWYGKAVVGDGADAVYPEDLDPWQRFAHDVVMDGRHNSSKPCRLMMMGTAGSGKSRTVRSFVGSRRARRLAQLAGCTPKQRRVDARSIRADVAMDLRVPEPPIVHHTRFAGPRVVAESELGENLGAALASRKRKGSQVDVEDSVRHCCLLSAPTGCASFQLRYGAATLHRAFGVPVAYVGPWAPGQRAKFKDGKITRYGRLLKRLDLAELLVMDELSMIGRSMLGKIDFKMDDTLRNEAAYKKIRCAQTSLGGKDACLSGDPKQAPPIGDEPMYKEGTYAGKGQNKPKGADRTPTGALDTHGLVARGVAVRDSFGDVVFLRTVHRYCDEKKELSAEQQIIYRKDAIEFLDVMRGLVDCTWTPQQYLWLARRNRTALQQTLEGREQLQRFVDAPLLMDGRVDRVTGEVGANRINRAQLEKLSLQTKKPILCIKAYHGVPDSPEGAKMKPEEMEDDDFRGIQKELLLCVGARVLLTQNLWVEAGLMNGAMGTVVGFCWPQNGDPRSTESHLRAPMCVFVVFDSVNLQDDAKRERSFFPGDPVRSQWVPIMRQQVSASLEDKVYRANFPLTLAWALTHWKAQGMTLDRVRVHLSQRTAALPGIGFVACTRVRHPWDLVFEEDLPEFEHWMKAKRTPAFRARCRFERMQLAKASRTLRRYGYCSVDAWAPMESTAAEELLTALFLGPRAEQKGRLSAEGRTVHADTWLWGDGEPDYRAELRKQAFSLAKGSSDHFKLYERVVSRLMDEMHVRTATDSETQLAKEIGKRITFNDGDNVEDMMHSLEGGLESCAQVCELSIAACRLLARKILHRVCFIGDFDGYVDEFGAVDALKELHLPAVQEALGALVPAWLGRHLDKAAQKVRLQEGVVSGGSVLSMDGWRVNVRSEDALARGRLSDDVLEFFRKVLCNICEVLDVAIYVGSVTVGKALGMQMSASRFLQTLGKWKQAFDRSRVNVSREFVLPVAVDEDRRPPQDWIFVRVLGKNGEAELGLAEKLRVQIYDPAKRVGWEIMQRVLGNVVALIKGQVIERSSEVADIEFCDIVKPMVGSQRILLAGGLMLRAVCCVAKQALGDLPILDDSSNAFVADVGNVLKGVFAYFRNETSSRGVRDVSRLLEKSEDCVKVLRMFGVAPTLARAAPPIVALDAILSDSRPTGHFARRSLAVLKIATWNIAGGHRSAQAPLSFNALDQRARLCSELQRWQHAFDGCDIYCLQECESEEPFQELLEAHDFVGAQSADQNRGFVQMYVRRGLSWRRLGAAEADPCVIACVDLSSLGSELKSLVVMGVHLPVGDRLCARRDIVKRAHGVAVADDASLGSKVVIVGDLNAKDDEVHDFCESMKIAEAKYMGASWGAPGNCFYADMVMRGFGLRKDRVLFGRDVWAEAHLVGQRRQFFEGKEFCLSDHFGLMAYVDVSGVYARRGKKATEAQRGNRKIIVDMRDKYSCAETNENKAQRNLGREMQVVVRQRASEVQRAAFQRKQQEAVRQRQQRGVALRESAFAGDSLFSEKWQCLLRDQEGALPVPEVPVAPQQISIPGLQGLGYGDWSLAAVVPLRGLFNYDNTCYVLSVTQILMRLPAFVDWMLYHLENACDGKNGGCSLCALGLTYQQVLAGWSYGSRPVPVIAARRTEVSAEFAGAEHQDACEFYNMFLARARERELNAMRFGRWDGVEHVDVPMATHAERLFGFVMESRWLCVECESSVRVWFQQSVLLQLRSRSLPGGPMTLNELYLDSCKGVGEANEAQWCEFCQRNAVHRKQSRMVSAPNILVVEIVRNVAGGRDLSGITVEEQVQFDVPGMPMMDLVGIVYYRPLGPRTGHYMNVCRGSGGLFWFCDDGMPVQKVTGEVGHYRPHQVKMVFYAPANGRAVFNTEHVGALVVGSDEVHSESVNGLGANCSFGVLPEEPSSCHPVGTGSRKEFDPVLARAARPKIRRRVSGKSSDVDAAAPVGCVASSSGVIPAMSAAAEGVRPASTVGKRRRLRAKSSEEVSCRGRSVAEETWKGGQVLRREPVVTRTRARLDRISENNVQE